MKNKNTVPAIRMTVNNSYEMFLKNQHFVATLI